MGYNSRIRVDQPERLMAGSGNTRQPPGMNRIIQIAIGQRSEHELGIMRHVFINERNKPLKNKVGALNVIETYEQVVNDPSLKAFIEC
jgi:hypothetical protein